MLRYKKEGYPHRLPSPAALPEILEEDQSGFIALISARQSLHGVSQHDISHREVTLNKEQTPQQPSLYPSQQAEVQVSPHNSVKFDQSHHSDEKLRQSHRAQTPIKEHEVVVEIVADSAQK